MDKVDHINYRLSQLLFRLHLMFQDDPSQKISRFKECFYRTYIEW